MARALIVDNYDSFAFNLVQLVGTLGVETVVRRNDALDLDDVERLEPSHIILSPGPGHPRDPERLGICREIIEWAQVPTLGVCLGHQGIARAFGARVTHAPKPVHGKASPIHHRGVGLFAGLPDGFSGIRYHSLVVERSQLPDCFELTAWTADGLVMGLEHKEQPLFGLQFHPESIGTEGGAKLIANFLETRKEKRPRAETLGR